MIIYLIGMMGSGKSSVGKHLASQLKYNFVDTDCLIEEKLNLKVHDIINQFGIEYFRQIENQVLREIQLDLNTVIATGGGIILNQDNINFMKNNGITIYLKTSINELEKRLTNPEMKKRPLLKKNSLYDIFEVRKELYDKASELTINCDNLSIETICEQIRSELKNRLC
ncbi:shikimate kinase [Mycoplasmatota bacterium]|nr:shikimate kinase [Mycoplasmatota bacterium]